MSYDLKISYLDQDYIILVDSLSEDWEPKGLISGQGYDCMDMFETCFCNDDKFLDLVWDEIEKKRKEKYHDTLENNL